MEIPAYISKTLSVIAIVSLVLFALSFYVNVWQALQPKAIAGTCNSLGSYDDILASYHAGNKRLDGDGDGIPCNARAPKNN